MILDSFVNWPSSAAILVVDCHFHLNLNGRGSYCQQLCPFHSDIHLALVGNGPKSSIMSAHGIVSKFQETAPQARTCRGKFRTVHINIQHTESLLLSMEGKKVSAVDTGAKPLACFIMIDMGKGSSKLCLDSDRSRSGIGWNPNPTKCWKPTC